MRDWAAGENSHVIFLWHCSTCMHKISYSVHVALTSCTSPKAPLPMTFSTEKSSADNRRLVICLYAGSSVYMHKRYMLTFMLIRSRKNTVFKWWASNRITTIPYILKIMQIQRVWKSVTECTNQYIVVWPMCVCPSSSLATFISSATIDTIYHTSTSNMYTDCNRLG